MDGWADRQIGRQTDYEEVIPMSQLAMLEM